MMPTRLPTNIYKLTIKTRFIRNRYIPCFNIYTYSSILNVYYHTLTILFNTQIYFQQNHTFIFRFRLFFWSRSSSDLRNSRLSFSNRSISFCNLIYTTCIYKLPKSMNGQNCIFYLISDSQSNICHADIKILRLTLHLKLLNYIQLITLLAALYLYFFTNA